MSKPFENLKAYQRGDEIMRVLRQAVREAQAESRRLGVANVYSINGKRYFELPDGTYTQTPPEGYRRLDAEE